MHTISKYLLSSYFTSKINLGWLSRLIYSVTHYIMRPIVVTHIIVQSFSKKGQRPLANLSTIFKTNEKTLDKRKLLMIKMVKIPSKKCNIGIKKKS